MVLFEDEDAGWRKGTSAQDRQDVSQDHLQACDCEG